MEPFARFVLPGVPKALERNRHRIVKTKTGGQFVANYLPAQSRAEQGAVRLFAQTAMAGRPPCEGPVELKMTAYMPVPASWSKKKKAAALAGTIRPTGKPDASNILKNLEDGMRQIVFRDDSQIVALHVWKLFSVSPRVVVEVRLIEDGAVQQIESLARPKVAESPLVGSL